MITAREIARQAREKQGEYYREERDELRSKAGLTGQEELFSEYLKLPSDKRKMK